MSNYDIRSWKGMLYPHPVDPPKMSEYGKAFLNLNLDNKDRILGKGNLMRSNFLFLSVQGKGKI